MVNAPRFIAQPKQARPYAAVLSLISMSAQAEDDRLIASFTNYPYGTLIMDKENNLYGVTGGLLVGGGGGTDEYGTVYKLDPSGTITVLHRFQANEGFWPYAGLVLDKGGNLYGSTWRSGFTDNCGDTGCGTIFKLSPDGTETVLHLFNGTDGLHPISQLILGKHGALYGTTGYGGNSGGNCGVDGCGVVFKLDRHGKETVLHAFTDTDGHLPWGRLLMDAAGNLYGTTYFGGGICSSGGCGVVFKLAPDGTETVLHAFTGSPDGMWPAAGLVMDKAGNLYGTTFWGGAHDFGTVFKLAPDGTETVLYSFTGGEEGLWPYCDLLLDKTGNLYGTTPRGGIGERKKKGVIFKLARDGTYTVLHAFTGRPEDAGQSLAGLIQDKDGNLYGESTKGGASNEGAVFTLKK